MPRGNIFSVQVQIRIEVLVFEIFDSLDLFYWRLQTHCRASNTTIAEHHRIGGKNATIKFQNILKNRKNCVTVWAFGSDLGLGSPSLRFRFQCFVEISINTISVSPLVSSAPLFFFTTV